MIPRAAITEWTATAAWKNLHQVEQDLIISRALVAIFSDEVLSSKLAFRGGTALHKLFFPPQQRYSEDIDLVQLKAEPVGMIINRLRDVLSFLGTPQIKQKMSNNVLLFRFTTTFPPEIQMKLKVEINCKEHFSVLGLTKMPFAVDNQWFSGNCEITIYQLAELLGTKLRALYQRRKGRDLFDLYKALTLQQVNTADVIRCYHQYMQFSVGNPPSSKEYLQNMELKMQDEEFINDMNGLLRPSENYDPRIAYELVKEEILEKL